MNKLLLLAPGHQLALEVRKLPVIISYRVAEEEQISGIHTAEGDVPAKVGDAILTTKDTGKSWPIRWSKFSETYNFDSLGDCYKKPIVVLAWVMNKDFSVTVSWVNTPIYGKPGDMLVRYGPDDLGVVSRDEFHTYELLAQGCDMANIPNGYLCPL